MVTLKSKNPKTQELSVLPPFMLPASHKHLAVQPTAVEARHFAATYALFRVCSMKNIHMMMPPNYRDLWKGEFQQLKADDVKQDRRWMYEADPFLAQREREEAKAQATKAREARQKQQAQALVASGPGDVAPQGPSRSSGNMKGWKTAPKVEMGQRTRKTVERVVKDGAGWNPNNLQISATQRKALLAELGDLGFRKSHVEEAAHLCRDREEVIEWLLVHVPEDDLPAWCFPENYSAGISLASSNMKREGAVKRLALGGFSRELCEEIYDACSSNEGKSAQVLQDTLLHVGDSASEERIPLNAVDSDTWAEEQEILTSIYGDRFEQVDQNVCRVRLDCVGMKQDIRVSFRKPQKSYPEHPPVISIDAPLPAYIRLSITRQALRHAVEDFSGVQMIFNIVDWLEHNVTLVIDNPGPLTDISSVSSSASATTDSGTHKSAPKRSRRPQALSNATGSSEDLQLFSQWQSRQSDPKQVKMVSVRQALPAWSLQESIVSAVNSHQVVIISGETGSGKSTQSVQFILDDAIRRKAGTATSIICTQPRRISALGLADRVAEERCSHVGQEIGYAIRGESRQTTGITKVTFVTTGVLLRRLQTSGGSTDDVVASLADVSHIFLDEVHERDLNTDFLLALLRTVLTRRRDLKLILMSATLDAAVFENYFGGPRAVGKVEIAGRTHPVDDYYMDDVARMTGYAAPDEEDARASQGLGRSMRAIGFGTNFELIAQLVEKIDSELGDAEGGILVFLSGAVEIKRALDAMRRIPILHALPLHASLPPAEQRKVFPQAPLGKRKVICSTNVAETSITIPDIVAVIDTGRVKETKYDPQTKMVKLEEVWASRAACKQRRGRAGRVRAGKCYKLFTRNAESKMAERPEPEIRRTPLEQLCLSVRAMGIEDVPGFLASTLTPPEDLAVESAIALLRTMGAFDGETLTALGRHLAMIPADLRCAKLIVYGALFGLLEPCLTIAAILSVKSPFVSPQEKREESKAARLEFGGIQGDIVADLNAYNAWCDTRSSSSHGQTRSWGDQNFLSHNILSDISTTRSQYLSSLKEIGFVSSGYRATDTPSQLSDPLLNALILSALYPQTLRISFPPQKYQSTVSGALAIDPESREIKYFDSDNNRVFVHPSSTLFSAQAFPNNAGFLSYFTKVETSKAFVRDLTPCGSYGLLLFGGRIELDTQGRGLVIDGWIRLRGWARIGVLVSRLRGILDQVLDRWVEEPGSQLRPEEVKIIGIVRKLVELEGLDR